MRKTRTGRLSALLAAIDNLTHVSSFDPSKRNARYREKMKRSYRASIRELSTRRAKRRLVIQKMENCHE